LPAATSAFTTITSSYNLPADTTCQQLHTPAVTSQQLAAIASYFKVSGVFSIKI